MEPERPDHKRTSDGANVNNINKLTGPIESDFLSLPPRPVGVDLLLDLKLGETVLTATEESALSKLTESIQSVMGFSDDDVARKLTSITTIAAPKPLRSGDGELVYHCMFFDKDAAVTLIPDINSILSLANDSPGPFNRRDHESFPNSGNPAEAGALIVFRFDRSNERWSPAVALSDGAFSYLVDRFLASMDAEDHKPGSGGATYLGVLIDRAIELELRRRGRSAGLRGIDLSETVEGLRSAGYGFVLKPEFEFETVDNGDKFKVSAICSFPLRGTFNGAEGPIMAERLTFEVGRNHLREVEVKVISSLELGPAATY
jgi:hypothetical protein